MVLMRRGIRLFVFRGWGNSPVMERMFLLKNIASYGIMQLEKVSGRDSMSDTGISVLIKRLALIFDKLSNQLLLPYDLTGSQFKILMALYHAPAGSVRQTDIEDKFSMTNPTVTGLVQKLEAKELVKRMPHPEDRRSKVLVLTDRAMDMKEELLALAESLEQQMTGNLAAQERRQLAALLLKMLQ